MPLTPQRAAARAADLIRRRGNTITLENGVTIKAITDEDATAVKKQFARELTEFGTGRVALFYMSDVDYQSIPAGSKITYDGLSWSVNTAKAEISDDVIVMRILLCITGNFG